MHFYSLSPVFSQNGTGQTQYTVEHKQTEPEGTWKWLDYALTGHVSPLEALKQTSTREIFSISLMEGTACQNLAVAETQAA